MVREWIRRIDSRGLTLPELLATLAIVGLVTLVATPSLITYWHTSTLGAGALELASAVNHARQVAISLNDSVCLAVERGRVTLEGAAASGCTGQPLSGPWPTTFALASGLSVENAGPNVVLTSLGAAVPGGTFRVTHPVTGAQRSVVVAASGRVSIR